MENPKLGDVVLHENGYQARVISLSDVPTKKGSANTYQLKFLEGPYRAVDCLREEFTFPVPARK